MNLVTKNFEQLALQHLDAVDRAAKSLSRNPAESDDLVQETFLRAYRSWEKFDLRTYGVKPWLLRILHNLHISRSVREARQPKAIADDQLQTVPGSDAPIDPESTRWEANPNLARAMQRLSTDLRTALILWAVDELSYQEIADVMSVPIGTVMSRLHRARKCLREFLDGVCN